MYRYFDNEIDRWWHAHEISLMPGRVVPFFGAGLSIDDPTHLPSGVELTKSLMNHLFDSTVATELLDTFEEHWRVLGRSVPRLEHLLSVATRSNAGAAKLLEIFGGNPPNRNHYVLADHLRQHRAWAVTTNFDECVEQASGFSIPVHVFDPESGEIKVLHGSRDTDWGLIKLHGTITQGADKLAATIESLTPGLAPPLQQLLDHVFSGTDFVLVAGYSGSDHFDVNRYLQSKLGRRFRARLMWLRHGSGSGSRADFPGSKTFSVEPGARGPDSFQTAFSGVACYSGDTCELLESFLGRAQDVTLASLKTPAWSALLKTLHVPSKADRHRMGASFCSAVGLVGLIDLCLPQLRYELESDQAGLFEYAVSLELKGYWAEARTAIRRGGRAEGKNVEFLIISNLRRSGQPVWALIEWVRLQIRLRRDRFMKRRHSTAAIRPNMFPLQEHLEAVACILDLWRSWRRKRIGRARIVSFAFERLIKLCFSRESLQRQGVIDAETEIIWQLIWLRVFAYSEHSTGERMDGWLWRVIEAEMAVPEFYTETGPLFPGFYLNARVTNAELDRVAHVFDVNLAYADALVACILNHHLDRSALLHVKIFGTLLGQEWLSWRLREQLYNDIEILVAMTKQQFEKARDAAAMLDNDEIYRRLSEAWLIADRSLYRFRTWTKQRIYMGMTKAEKRAMESLVRGSSAQPTWEQSDTA